MWGRHQLLLGVGRPAPARERCVTRVQVLRAALNKARKSGIVTQNVAELMESPRHQVKEIQPLSPEQARALMEAAKGSRLGALVSVATALGLRLGEALGLRWADVDYVTGTLAVRQALERSGGDVAARRPLIAKRRAIRARLKASEPRSAERRAIWAELFELRKAWREVRTTLRTTEPNSTRSRPVNFGL